MPELIDVLDENGIRTGRIATREEVHREGLWHQIAVVVIIDNDGRILLQQRSKNKRTNPEKWDIAAAGHVDAGEDSLLTARREVEEELGIVVDNLQFLLSYSRESRYEWQGESLLDRQLFDCFLSRVVKVDIDGLRLQDSEVQAAMLCTAMEFRRMIDNGDMVKRSSLYEEVIKIMEQE